MNTCVFTRRCSIFDAKCIMGDLYEGDIVDRQLVVFQTYSDDI